MNELYPNGTIWTCAAHGDYSSCYVRWLDGWYYCGVGCDKTDYVRLAAAVMSALGDK